MDTAKFQAKRGARGRFERGTAPGPGRPPKGIEEKIVEAAQLYAKPIKEAVDAIELARRCSPAVMGRLIELATDAATDPDTAVSAAKIVLERAHGLPTAMTVSLNADLSPDPERIAAANTALAKLRSLLEADPSPACRAGSASEHLIEGNGSNA